MPARCSNWCTAATACIRFVRVERDLARLRRAPSARRSSPARATSASNPDSACRSVTTSSSPGCSRDARSPASMRQVTAPTANNERSTASISSVGPVSSSTPPRCPQRASRSPAVTGPMQRLRLLRSVASGLDAAVIMPAATVALVSGSIRINAPVARFSPIEIDSDRPQQMQRNRADVVHAPASTAGSRLSVPRSTR